MRSALLLAAFLLTACAPAQVVITASAGDVLPAEAQRVIDRATATAGAVATQVAGVTAAALATRDTLAIEQTHAALALTQGAAQAQATTTAAERTQTAQETHQARYVAQQATYAAQTPTVAAGFTQAALQATQAVTERDRQASVSAFWEWVRWTTVAALIGLALVVCVLVLMRGIVIIRAEERRAEAATAREAFKVLAPGHWAEWTAGHGYDVYPLPGLLDAPPVIIENTPTGPSHLHSWRHAVRLFAWWGDRYGFGIRELGAEGAGVVSDPVWRRLSKLLKDAGVLAEVTIPGKKGKATAWAGGWDYRRLTDDLSTGRLALPFPAGDVAPKVAFAVPTQHQNSTQHESATQVIG